VPRSQIWESAQLTPQRPQFARSCSGSTQRPVQAICPAAQSEQPPFTQNGAESGHAWPHEPQLFRSVLRFRQTPSGQSVCPRRHGRIRHEPFRQLCKTVQATPQPPQFVGLDCRSAHSPAQQVLPEAQTVPQAPQFCASLATFRHAPAQHACPLAQTWPQPPQLFRSVWVATQTSPQQAVPKVVPQPKPHPPPTMAASAGGRLVATSSTSTPAPATASRRRPASIHNMPVRVLPRRSRTLRANGPALFLTVRLDGSVRHGHRPLPKCVRTSTWSTCSAPQPSRSRPKFS